MFLFDGSGKSCKYYDQKWSEVHREFTTTVTEADNGFKSIYLIFVLGANLPTTLKFNCHTTHWDSVMRKFSPLLGNFCLR